MSARQSTTELLLRTALEVDESFIKNQGDRILSLEAAIVRKHERIVELTRCLHTVGALIGRLNRSAPE
jgi:hypothetical protein